MPFSNSILDPDLDKPVRELFSLIPPSSAVTVQETSGFSLWVILGILRY